MYNRILKNAKIKFNELNWMDAQSKETTRIMVNDILNIFMMIFL